MKFLQQTHIKYALIMTLVIASCLFLMELTGQNQSFDNKSPIQIAFMFIAPAVIWFLGIKERKKILKGKLTFKQGLKEGIKISVVYGLISPFVFLFYYILINPEIVEYAKKSYGLPNASTGLVIGIDMLVQLIASIIFGTIYAAIISFFVRSK